MWLLVGLGNPGDEYKNTRHNIGFVVLDTLFESFTHNKKVDGLMDKSSIEGQTVHALKPQTFMNASGMAVQKALSYYDISPKNLIVVYDDADLAFGQIKVGQNTSSGGHNGIQSILDHIGTSEFHRVRIGIQPQEDMRKQAGDIVLKDFSSEEQKTLPELIGQAIHKIEELIKSSS